jgi:hypothetical protein
LVRNIVADGAHARMNGPFISDSRTAGRLGGVTPLRSRPLGALAACVLALAPFVVTRADDAAGRARDAVRAGRLVPAQSLLDWLEERYLGRVIELELDDDDSPPTYEIEWLTPRNDVLEFEFDARTGALLEVEGRGLEEARKP